MTTAKLFKNGRSQAVRLPKAFRFAADEVSIRKEGKAVILEPLSKRRWPAGYFAKMAKLSNDFVRPKDTKPRPLKLDLE